MILTNAPWRNLELEVTVSLDVHTTSTIDSGSLKPVQTLNTDGTTVVDSTKDLGNGDRRSTTEFLTKINHTLILPVQGRTKDNWRNSRENWDTQPHVTGVGEGSNRVQIEVGDNIGLQRVEGKVTTVDDGARSNGHRSSQTIGGRHVESTIVVEVASKNSEHIVHNGEVHSRIDIKLANFQVDGRHQDGVFSDGQGPSLLKKKGRSSDGQKKFHWIKQVKKVMKKRTKIEGFYANLNTLDIMGGPLDTITKVIRPVKHSNGNRPRDNCRASLFTVTLSIHWWTRME